MEWELEGPALPDAGAGGEDARGAYRHEALDANLVDDDRLGVIGEGGRAFETRGLRAQGGDGRRREAHHRVPLGWGGGTSHQAVGAAY